MKSAVVIGLALVVQLPQLATGPAVLAGGEATAATGATRTGAAEGPAVLAGGEDMGVDPTGAAGVGAMGNTIDTADAGRTISGKYSSSPVSAMSSIFKAAAAETDGR